MAGFAILFFTWTDAVGFDLYGRRLFSCVGGVARCLSVVGGVSGGGNVVGGGGGGVVLVGHVLVCVALLSVVVVLVLALVLVVVAVLLLLDDGNKTPYKMKEPLFCVTNVVS